MSLEMSQVTASGRPVVQAYGGGGFKIDGGLYDGAVLILPDGATLWPVKTAAEVSLDSLSPIVARKEEIDILLIGCGASFAPPPKGLRQSLKDQGLSLEWMDTGAACRTFNILLTEERRVAAAVLAVD